MSGNKKETVLGKKIIRKEDGPKTPMAKEFHRLFSKQMKKMAIWAKEHQAEGVGVFIHASFKHSDGVENMVSAVANELINPSHVAETLMVEDGTKALESAVMTVARLKNYIGGLSAFGLPVPNGLAELFGSIRTDEVPGKEKKN